MDGWNEDKVFRVEYAIDEITKAGYELQNCVKGCYTGARTYSELSNYLCKLADRLREEAESIAYEDEDDEEEGYEDPDFS